MENKYIFIIILFFCILFYFNKDNIEYKFDDIFKYSLMVHLVDNKISSERLNKVKNVYENYNIKLNIIPATHTIKDKEILKTFPITNKHFDFKRIGVYGLCGSFYKSIKQAYDLNWPFLLFFEDDAIPIIKNKTNFFNELNKSIKILPNNNDIFFLGATIYCNNYYKKYINKGWISNNDIQKLSGAHAIYFPKNSIIKIMEHLKNNKIDRAIDNWINQNFKKWLWCGTISENGMFLGLFEQIDTNCSDRINIIDNLII